MASVQHVERSIGHQLVRIFLINMFKALVWLFEQLCQDLLKAFVQSFKAGMITARLFQVF